MKIIKFIGDWKKLIPMGYEFLRMYASNYICYHNVGGMDLSSIWIWKKGKDVEVGCYGNSHLVLEYLIENDFNRPKNFDTIVYNVELKRFEEYEHVKHDLMFQYKSLEELQSLSREDIKKASKEWKEKFIQIMVVDEVRERLKELYSNGMIEIAEIEANI